MDDDVEKLLKTLISTFPHGVTLKNGMFRSAFCMEKQHSIIYSGRNYRFLGRCKKLQHLCTRDQTQGDQKKGTQDQQSLFSWQVHPAEQRGCRGRTPPVFSPRPKRWVLQISVIHRLSVHTVSSFLKFESSVHIFFQKVCSSKYLCTLDANSLPGAQKTTLWDFVS